MPITDHRQHIRTRLNRTEKGDFNLMLTFMLVPALQQINYWYAYVYRYWNTGLRKFSNLRSAYSSFRWLLPLKAKFVLVIIPYFNACIRQMLMYKFFKLKLFKHAYIYNHDILPTSDRMHKFLTEYIYFQYKRMTFLVYVQIVSLHLHFCLVLFKQAYNEAVPCCWAKSKEID